MSLRSLGSREIRAPGKRLNIFIGLWRLHRLATIISTRCCLVRQDNCIPGAIRLPRELCLSLLEGSDITAPTYISRHPGSKRPTAEVARSLLFPNLFLPSV